MIKSAKPLHDDTQDNSPIVGDLMLTVTRVESVPIRASKAGRNTYGQLVDDALVRFYENQPEQQRGGLLTEVKFSLTEDAAHTLAHTIYQGKYGE